MPCSPPSPWTSTRLTKRSLHVGCDRERLRMCFWRTSGVWQRCSAGCRSADCAVPSWPVCRKSYAKHFEPGPGPRDWI